MRKFPRLYPNHECPLCRQGVANDHHVFARCPFITTARAKAISTVKNNAQANLRKVIRGLPVPTNLIKFCFAPRDPANFKHGQLHIKLKEWAEQHLGEEEGILWGKSLQRDIMKEYANIWNIYTDTLAEKKVNFAKRLKDEYSITPKMMGRTPAEEIT